MSLVLQQSNKDKIYRGHCDRYQCPIQAVKAGPKQPLSKCVQMSYLVPAKHQNFCHGPRRFSCVISRKKTAQDRCKKAGLNFLPIPGLTFLQNNPVLRSGIRQTSNPKPLDTVSDVVTFSRRSHSSLPRGSVSIRRQSFQ